MSQTIGDNIARRRRALGITQETLAEAAGVSVETIRKLEQNERTAARMSTLNRIARPLRVPTSALLGNAAQSAARREPDHDELALLAVRRALTPARGIGGAVVGGLDTEPTTLADLARSIQTVDRAYHADDYATTLAALPALLAEARTLVATVEGHERERALGLLAQSHQVAATALIQLRSFDLAHRALSLALDAADESGDDLVGASAVVTMCWLLLRQGRFDEAGALAVSTADAVEPRLSRVEPPRLAAWGWLVLRAAAVAARDNRDDDATGFLDAAAAAAARMGGGAAPQGPTTIGAFCESTVAMKRVESAVVAGDYGRALRLAEQVPRGSRPTSNNWNRHLLDVASAHVGRHAYGEATDTLLQIRSVAPTWLRHQRLARDLVGTVVAARRRAMGPELTELASLVGAEL
jgi:transcriptional regulator with XRE-family HTH domain